MLQFIHTEKPDRSDAGFFYCHRELVDVSAGALTRDYDNYVYTPSQLTLYRLRYTIPFSPYRLVHLKLMDKYV